MYLGRAEKLQQPAELSNPQPFDRVDTLDKIWIGLVNEGCRNNSLHARAARGKRKLLGINAVAGDDSECLGNLHDS